METPGARSVLWCVVAVAAQAVLGGCGSEESKAGSGWNVRGQALTVRPVSYDSSADVFDDGARPLVFNVGPMEETPTGTLVVETPTRTVWDGRVFYHPHTAYSIYSADGDRLRRVRNHLGENDERPTRVTLAPGRYVVRPDARESARREFAVVIERDRTTRVEVEELIAAAR